ncbi:MAG: hypothetical protein MUC29_11640 [Pyrinomonadaceae bacterium]|jgi:hypothetical protein|nr:hypothetical protein [Pyrinomonadaceae bacterium]
MKISVTHTRKEELSDELTQIEVYDTRLKFSETVTVEKLTETKFRVVENAVFIYRLKFGTEFETQINQDGQYEIVKITKRSEFKTKRFMLSPKFTQSEYQILGDEIMKQGGYWQVDFGSIATVNLPKDSTLDLDEIFRVFEVYPSE